MENLDNQTIKTFSDLKVWQEGHRLVIMIYGVTKLFPKEELYSLVDQMKRAGISITSNIAEGFGRQTYKEKYQFYHQAQGSLTELHNQLLIAKDIGYINPKEFETLTTQINSVSQLLRGLIRKTKTFIKAS